MERAFNTAIHQFQHNGKSFRANVQNAQLSGAAASYVSSVSGLESHQVRPLISRAVNLKTKQPFPSVALSKVQASGGLSSVITNQILSAPSTFTFTTPGASLPVGIYYGNVYGANPNLVPDYAPAQLQQIYGLTAAYEQGLNGKGQTILLLEAYGHPPIEQDANVFFKLAGLPQLDSSNFQIVYPEGQPVSTGTETVGWGDTVTYINLAGVLDPPEVLGLVGGGGGSESLYFAKPAWQKSLPGTGRQTPDDSALADPYTGVPIVLTNGTQQLVEAGRGY